MPEFTVKEVRLPELRLPELKREEIVRSLSGVRLPEVDLAKARRASIKIPTVNVTSSDVGKLLAAAATIARFVRPAPTRVGWLAGPIGRRARSPISRIVQPRRRRSCWPFAIGAIIAVVIAAVAMTRHPAVRQRLDAATRDARVRLDALRNGNDNNDTTAMEVHEPTALAALDDAQALTESLGEDAAASDAPSPAFEETGSPA